MSWATVSERYRQLAHEHLTDKQLRVLQLWLDGHGIRTIARALELDESTVRIHRNRAIQKMRDQLRKEPAA